MSRFKNIVALVLFLGLVGNTVCAASEPETWWTGPWTVADKVVADPSVANTNRLSLTQLVGSLTNTTVVASRNVLAPKDAEVVLRVGSDDGLTVRLDGKVVWRNAVERALLADEDHVLLTLTKGLHRLDFQVDQALGDWGLEAHLVSWATEQGDAARNPARSLVLRVSAQGRSLSGLVVTAPGFATRGEFRLVLTLPDGGVTTTAPLALGTPFSIDVPSTSPARPAPGYVRVAVQGLGPIAALRAEEQIAPLGAWDSAVTDLGRRALALAGRSDSVLQATYEFLAQQVTGRVHPALATADRQRTAALDFLRLEAAGVTRLALLPPGTWQLAHRSTIDASVQPFSLNLPPRQAGKAYRLLVALHGHGGTDRQAVQMGVTAAPNNLITVAPLGRGDVGYHVLGEQDVIEVMNLVMQTWTVDSDRVYLTGSSMGGAGTWRLGQVFSDRFAAIVPFAGWTETTYLGNLRNVATTIVHGTADPVVPIQPDRNAAASLNDRGFRSAFIPLEGADHNAWGAFTRTEGPERLMKLLSVAVRPRWPREVEITALHLRYRTNTWTRLEELDKSSTPGSLEAKVQDPKHVSVRATNLRAFSLDLSHPELATKGRLIVDINGRSVPVDAGARWVTFEAASSGAVFRAAGNEPPVAVPHDGGGLTDLFYRPLLIVYGAQGGHEALWKTVATAFSDWSVGPEGGVGTKGGLIPVVKDVDVTPAQLASHSVLLLGASDENRLAASMAAKLPFQATTGRVTVGNQTWDHLGLLATAPSPWAADQLVSWLSLPFEAGQAQALGQALAQSLRSYSRPGHDVTSTIFPDVVVFGADFTPVFQANFDRRWQLRTPAP